MAYLLDTDSISLAYAGNERVLTRIRQAPVSDVWLSSIAVEENMRGALNLIHRDRDKAASPAAHEFLKRLMFHLCDHRIHPYNEQAARVYASFSAKTKLVGSQDCRLAASAIAAGWIVVTVNRKDFSRIPGVQFEDWSR